MKQQITDSVKGHRTLQSASQEIRHLLNKTGKKFVAVFHCDNGGYYTVEQA